jgi:hypothetical protein
MIYGNNVEANLEYFQRRMVEKALDALQSKHDELVELVAKVIDQHRIEEVIVCDEGCWCWELEAALNKFVKQDSITPSKGVRIDNGNP